MYWPAHLLRLVPGEAVRGGAVAGARHLEPAVRAAPRPRHQQQNHGHLHAKYCSELATLASVKCYYGDFQLSVECSPERRDKMYCACLCIK